MNKLLLVVGNGLSIDAFQYFDLRLDPSHPFLFGVPDPLDPSKKLMDTLTSVRDMIDSHPNVTDFEIIQDFIANYKKNNKGHIWTHCELRQYLSLAYSFANDLLLTHWKEGWRWAQWLRRHYKRIAGVVSFNYDLVLETALQQSSLGYYRIGSTEEDNPIGTPIFKPHGSCDFDISSRFISIPPQARLRNLTRLNDYVINGRGRIEIVSKGKLLEPRTESDVVLPFEFSPQTQLTWVRQGYEAVSETAKTVDALIIVGISYQPCDRREIDSILDEIPTHTAIRLVDQRPNAEFETKLTGVSDNAKCIHPIEFLGDII